MKISKIELDNFRQYYGNVDFEFDTDSKKNIAVIVGVNGAGKSNLYNAITWCLYGLEKHSEHKQGGLRRLNERRRHELKKNKYADVNVRITFEGTSPLRVERTQKFVKTADGFVVESSEEHKVWYHEEGSWKISNQPTATVNARIPQGIRKFFFFDGERLDEFFKPGLEEKRRVRDAVNDVAGVNIIDKTIKHLNTVERKLSKNAGKGNPELEIIQDKMRILQDEMDDRGKHIESMEQHRSALEIEIEECNKILKDQPVKEISEYQKDREELENDVRDMKDALLKKNLSRIDLVVDNGPYIFATKAYRESLEKLEEATEKGQLSSGIETSFVKELLKNGECICGTDIAHDGSTRARVEGFLKEDELAHLSLATGDLKWKLDTRAAAVSTTSELLGEFGREIAGIKSKMEKKQIRLKEISERLKNVDTEEIGQAEVRRTDFVKQLEGSKIKLAVEKSRQKEDKDGMKALKDDFNKQMRRHQQLAKIQDKLEFTNNALNVLQVIRDEYVSEVREKINANTDRYFKELIWKKKEFQGVTIDEDFEMMVRNKYGNNVKHDLSAGERQILALSFMAALKDITGYNAPVLIDTPLARISRKNRDNIAESLPKYLKDTQLILLVTDEEYTPSVKKKLDVRTSNRYELVFDEELSSTGVVKI